MKSFNISVEEHQAAVAATAMRSRINIERAAHYIKEAAHSNKMILTCGNGGSATDAAHLTEELVGRFGVLRDPIKSVCLNADATLMTCIANDFGWDKVFSRQVEALGVIADVLVAFSTSGDSPNVIAAVEAANRGGLYTICLVGEHPGIAGSKAALAIKVESSSKARIQEVHTFILHYFMECIEEAMTPKNA